MAKGEIASLVCRPDYGYGWEGDAAGLGDFHVGLFLVEFHVFDFLSVVLDFRFVAFLELLGLGELINDLTLDLLSLCSGI